MIDIAGLIGRRYVDENGDCRLIVVELWFVTEKSRNVVEQTLCCCRSIVVGAEVLA